MAYTESSKKATIKYIKNAYDRIEIKVPKGRKADIDEHARHKGVSINGLVNALLRADMGIPPEDWKQG